MKRLSDLRSEIDGWKSLQKLVQDTLELAELNDESLAADLETEAAAIEKEVSSLELKTLLSGPYDKGNALLAINAGAGGTEAMDWAAMLERMFLRWAERRGYSTEILDFTEGE